MLVNTSKVGQFVMPLSMADTTTTVTDMDSPWWQVMNYPSVRNIAQVKRMSPLRQTVLRMKVNATEDYIRNESEGATDFGPTAPPMGGIEQPWLNLDPQQSAIGLYSAQASTGGAGAIRAARFQMGRRRFRWTRQWLLWHSSNAANIPNYLYVRNDRKLAHGVQFMVKEFSYWQSTVPYFNVSITAQVEFRGKLLQQLASNITNGTAVMFPFTNATFATVL